MNSLFRVNGKPFFSIGGQTNNSTSYSRDKVRHAMATANRIGLNTIAAPVYWELLEPQEGQFDFSQLEMLLEEAREHGLKLVVLWFGTWKNGNSHYVPQWLKRDTRRFLWARAADGVPVCSLSPHCEATLEADKKAFGALCGRIARINSDSTILGIQVENEPGLIGTPRDYGPEAQKLFCEKVPREVAEHMGRQGTWEEVFGYDAGEFFTAWAIARYIDRVAAVGKAAVDLPMYTNVWLGEMHNRVAGIDYPSGGAVTKTLSVFRLGAPTLDTISPDIYLQDQKTWDTLNAAYQDGIHPYYVPELLPGPLAATRAIQAVVENGLSGVHYFMIDVFSLPDGTLTPRFREAAEAMGILRDMRVLIERYQGTDKLYAVTQYEGMSEQYIDFGDYIGSVRFASKNGDLMAKNTDQTMDNCHFALPDDPRRGKGIICYEGNGRFYLAGSNYRLMLFPKDHVVCSTSPAHSGDFLNQRTQPFLSVCEGRFDASGNYQVSGRRNGDEADYGFWVTPDVGVVRVEMNSDFYRGCR